MQRLAISRRRSAPARVGARATRGAGQEGASPKGQSPKSNARPLRPGIRDLAPLVRDSPRRASGQLEKKEGPSAPVRGGAAGTGGPLYRHQLKLPRDIFLRLHNGDPVLLP